MEFKVYILNRLYVLNEHSYLASTVFKHLVRGGDFGYQHPHVCAAVRTKGQSIIMP
jgi:hypothetical protein